MTWVMMKLLLKSVIIMLDCFSIANIWDERVGVVFLIFITLLSREAIAYMAHYYLAIETILQLHDVKWIHIMST